MAPKNRYHLKIKSGFFYQVRIKISDGRVIMCELTKITTVEHRAVIQLITESDNSKISIFKELASIYGGPGPFHATLKNRVDFLTWTGVDRRRASLRKANIGYGLGKY